MPQVKSQNRHAETGHVGDDLLTRAETRCPSCRAAVRPGAPWCTLCHADLRPAPAPVAPPVAVPAPVAVPEQPLAEAPAETSAGAGWPCATCGHLNGLTASTCAACGAGFLAALREADAPSLVLPGVGDLMRLSRGQRIGLAAAVVLAFVALTALVGLLFS